MLETIIQIATVTFTALLAGIFLAYSVSIISAWRKLDDLEYVRFMQANDRAIRNPLFFLIFMAPIILLPVAAFMAYGESSFGFWLVAALAYIVGPLGITGGGNEPINQRLVGFKLAGSTPDDLADLRKSTEEPWKRLHAWRTILALVSTGSVIVALAL